MPKIAQKTHKGLTKRVKVSARGKVRHKKPFAGHLMSGKRGRRKQGLRRPGEVWHGMAERIKQAMGEL